MNGIALLTEIARTNPTDVQAIEAQCGGMIGVIEMMAHMEAITTSMKSSPDPVLGLVAVMKHNEDDIRYLFKDVGGVEGFLKIFPNLINIYGTYEKSQKTGV